MPSSFAVSDTKQRENKNRKNIIRLLCTKGQNDGKRAGVFPCTTLARYRYLAEGGKGGREGGREECGEHLQGEEAVGQLLIPRGDVRELPKQAPRDVHPAQHPRRPEPHQKYTRGGDLPAQARRVIRANKGCHEGGNIYIHIYKHARADWLER